MRDDMMLMLKVSAILAVIAKKQKAKNSKQRLFSRAGQIS
jgi:hypothetical protein